MKSFVSILVLSTILLPSLAAPIADRGPVASSGGQDSLASPDGFNTALNPQDTATSPSGREAFNSSAVAEKDYGFGPLKYFTWRLQMQAREIRKSLLISPQFIPSTVVNQLIR
jgi:hypothetical protein